MTSNVAIINTSNIYTATQKEQYMVVTFANVDRFHNSLTSRFQRKSITITGSFTSSSTCCYTTLQISKIENNGWIETQQKLSLFR